MVTLNRYFSSNNSYTPNIESNIIMVRAKIPPFYEDKVQRIIKVKHYASNQEYLTKLFNDNKELEEVIIPYEILKIIDHEYNSIVPESFKKNMDNRKINRSLKGL